MDVSDSMVVSLCAAINFRPIPMAWLFCEKTDIELVRNKIAMAILMAGKSLSTTVCYQTDKPVNCFRRWKMAGDLNAKNPAGAAAGF